MFGELEAGALIGEKLPMGVDVKRGMGDSTDLLTGLLALEGRRKVSISGRAMGEELDILSFSFCRLRIVTPNFRRITLRQVAFEALSCARRFAFDSGVGYAASVTMAILV